MPYFIIHCLQSGAYQAHKMGDGTCNRILIKNQTTSLRWSLLSQALERSGLGRKLQR